MLATQIKANQRELDVICEQVKAMIEKGQYARCLTLIRNSMSMYPSASRPHNLMGILMEKQGDHINAMKHFRAAYALDPSYAPSAQNLFNCGTPYSRGKIAYSPKDCMSCCASC